MGVRYRVGHDPGEDPPPHVEQSHTADEVIIVLPNGIEFSLFAGDEGDNEVVALITATEPLVPHRFVLRPGAVNQVGIGAE